MTDSRPGHPVASVPLSRLSRRAQVRLSGRGYGPAMHRSARTVLSIVIVAATLAGCSSVASSSASPAVTGSPGATPAGSPAGAASDTRTSEGGKVTVLATWKGPATGAAIDVALDTHSVDLDALDLADATLRNDRGETLTARPWGAPKGGHHREGALAFDGDGPGFLAGARWLELVLVGVGDLPVRTLRWELDS